MTTAPNCAIQVFWNPDDPLIAIMEDAVHDRDMPSNRASRQRLRPQFATSPKSEETEKCHAQ